MKRIIFLEIDGVLTTQKGTDEAMKRRGDIFDSNGVEYFCQKAVEALNKIITATEADIVITSIWRNSIGIEQMRNLFKERGINGDIIGYTPILNSSGNGYEIESWLEKNGYPSSYVIIDDEGEIQSLSEIFPDDRCVATRFIDGLASKSCYKRAINYLNKPVRKVKVKSESKKLF